MYMYVICTCVVTCTCTCTSHIPFGDQNNSRFGEQKDDQNNSYFGEQKVCFGQRNNSRFGDQITNGWTIGHVHIQNWQNTYNVHNYTFSIKITL